MHSTNFSFDTRIDRARGANGRHVQNLLSVNIKAEKKIKNFIFDQNKLLVGVQLSSLSEIHTKSKKKGSLAFGIKLEECLKFERNLRSTVGLGLCQELLPRNK